MPVFYNEIVQRIQEEGSVPENDARYKEENIVSLVNARMKYYIVPLMNELAVSFFVIAAGVPLLNSDGSQRFINNIIPFPHRGVGRGLRELKWRSQGYEYKIPRKGIENDLVNSLYLPFVYDVVGEGIRVCAFNNNSTDINSNLSGDLVFYYAVSPPKLVTENISAPLVQVLYDIDNKITYFTLDVGTATDFPISGQVLTDIVSTKGKAFYTTNCMIYYYANDFYEEEDSSSYITYKTDEHIPWGDLDARQSLGFRILNMEGPGQIRIYSSNVLDDGKTIGIQGYDAKGVAVSLSLELSFIPVSIDTSMRFLYQVNMTGSGVVGDIIIENEDSFRFARIPAGIVNCKVGSVLPYETSDIYLNKSGYSSFLVIPEEAIELLILVTALNILQNQGDVEAFSTMEKRVESARKTVMNVLKDTVVGSPEVVVNDYGLDKFLNTCWSRWW